MGPGPSPGWQRRIDPPGGPPRNFSFAIATALAVMDAGARFLPSPRLWLPAALFLTQPLAALAFGVFSSDGAAAFFSFLSLYAFLNTLRERNQGLRGGWMKLAALLAGFAVAVKPVALIHAAVLLILLCVRAIQDADERRPGLLLACAGLFVLPLLPWLCRNWALASNPVYPFGFDLLGLKPASSIYLEHLSGFGSQVPAWRLPWDATFEAAQFGGDGHLSFLFLALPSQRPFSSASRVSCAGSAPTSSPASFFGRWARACCATPCPAVPGLCLFAAYGLSEIEDWAASRSWSMALRLLVIGTLFLNAGQIFLVALKDFNPFESALGLEKTEDYLLRRGR